jgi:hypothetical protein
MDPFSDNKLTPRGHEGSKTPITSPRSRKTSSSQSSNQNPEDSSNKNRFGDAGNIFNKLSMGITEAAKTTANFLFGDASPLPSPKKHVKARKPQYSSDDSHESDGGEGELVEIPADVNTEERRLLVLPLSFPVTSFLLASFLPLSTSNIKLFSYLSIFS